MSMFTQQSGKERKNLIIEEVISKKKEKTMFERDFVKQRIVK